MRLIDADAFMDTINRNCYPVQHDMTSIEPGMTRMGILQAIQEQPTIEPQRKRGWWIKKTIKKKIENDYSCSECGRHVSVMRGYDVRMVYPFCHCGADMTEGEE